MAVRLHMPLLTRRSLLSGLPLLALEACSISSPLSAPAKQQTRAAAAFLLPMKADGGHIGRAIEHAAQLAAMGQSAIVFDTGDSDATATAAAQAAVAGGARLLIGPLRSTQVAPVLAGAGDVPLVTFSNDSLIASNQVFVFGVTPEQSVATMFSYARAQGLSRVAVIASESALGIATAAAAESVAKAGGMNLSAVLLRNPAAKNTVADLRAASGGVLPEAVLIPDGGAALDGLARGLRDAGVQVMGGIQWGASAALGNPDLDGGWFVGPPPAVFDSFAARYETTYGEEPGVVAALGYDAMTLAQAVTSADSVKSALVRRQGFEGVLGRFYFTSDGRCRRDLTVLTFRQGGVLALGEVVDT